MTFSQTVTLQKQWKQFYKNPDCLKESLKIRKVGISQGYELLMRYGFLLPLHDGMLV